MRFSKACFNSFLAVTVASIVLAACSGHGPGSSMMPSTGSAARGTGHVKPNSTSGVTVSGSISAMISGGFTLNTGTACGYIHVYTSPSTTMSGPAPAVGLNAQATGSGSCATSIAATSVSTSTASPSASPIPAQTTISVAGPITGMISGGFTLNAGTYVGHIHIFTNGSTTVTGGTPAAGLYAQVTGAGSLSTNVTAVYVTLWASAPGSVTVSGTAKAATPYGFTLNASSTYPAVPIVMNAATIVAGAPLTTGAAVKVTGIGATNESITAQQVVVSAPTPSPGSSPTPTPGPISTKHLLTADYLGAPDGTTSIAWSAAAPFLTWAQTGRTSASAIAAAGIKTQFYADPNRTQAGVGDPLYTSDETTFAHDCNNNRVTDAYNGSVTEYVMNIGGASMQSLFANYVNGVAATAHFDAVFEDGSGPLSDEVYTPFSAMPCNYSDASWLSYGETLNQASSVPIIFNGLDALNGQNVSLSIGLLASSNTMGGNYEDCYSQASTPKMSGWNWQAVENTELQVAAQNKLFQCQLRDAGTASSQTDARIYALASFLLSYNPATSIFWEEFATPSGLHVEPESQLVALAPVVSTPSSVSGLQVSGGTYGREYAHCYYAGAFVGPCAVVVNSDTVPHPFPYPQYNHTLVLNGGGVLDGGTVLTTGPPPPLTLAGTEAEVVFP